MMRWGCLYAFCVSLGVAVPLAAQDAVDDRPVVAPQLPEMVQPAPAGEPNKACAAPSDAIVLFDGSSLDGWESSRKDAEVGWRLTGDGAMEIVPRTGSIRTRQAYGYGQYHVEFRTPAEVEGRGQGRGNSGVFIMGGPEVQVLDSVDNPTYSDGQCGAIYGQHIPLVNASRGPGEWQTFDIIVHPPQKDAKGKVARLGMYTVLHNGVLIHDHVPISALNNPNRTGPLMLQDHGDKVQYRNLWYRPFRRQIARQD